MANAEAWNAGWAEGRERSDERRQHKQALSDQELEGKIGELVDNRKAIQAKLPTLLDDKGQPTPEYNQAIQSLTSNAQALREIYHPNANPSAVARYGHLLTDMLHLTSPADRQQKDAAKQDALHRSDVKTAQGVAAAAPPSPMAVAGQQTQAEIARQNALNDANIAWLKKNNAPQEVIDQAIAHAGGAPVARPKPLPGAKAYRAADGRYYLPMQDASGQITQQQMPPDYVPPVAKGLKFDTNTGQVVNLDTGQRYNEGDPNNPPEVSDMLGGASKFTAKKQAFQEKLAAIRSAAYGQARQMQPLSVLDTGNGNAPTYATYQDMMKNPGRFLPAGEADKSLARENLMQDITGTSKLTREAINNMKEDFPIDMKLKIVAAMRADDPHAALDNLIASGAVGSLTPDQQDFLIATRQLAENAMAMRTILGAGQGSEDMRNAIRDTLPGLLTPDRSMALRQLDAFDKTIARLHRGVPKVPLRTDLDAGGNSNSGNDMITVKLKDGRTGKIHSSQKDKFIKDHPGAAEVTGAN